MQPSCVFSGNGSRRAALFWSCGLLVLVSAATLTSQSEAASQTTGAIGQIVPEGGIVGVMGAPGSLAAEILVHTSQQVKAGTLLMRTRAGTPDTDPAQVRKQLAVVQELAEQQLAAQTADVTLAQSRYDQAKKQLATYQALGTSITSKKELDALTVAAGDAATALVAEQARLKAIKTQNQSNLGVARRQLEAAVQGTELRAPVDGTILKINRHVGERLGNDPAVQLGNLSAMYVICQIYEGDLLRLKPGMTATVTARPLPQPLHGHIEEIGRLVDTQSRLG